MFVFLLSTIRYQLSTKYMPLRLTKFLSLFLSFCLILEQSVFAQSIDLSHYFANSGKPIIQSDKFRPLHLRYLGYDNLSQDFKLLLDKGDTKKEDLENKAYIEENTQTLLKYFFIGLSLPNDKFWVNLRPDASENIIDDDLAKTDIGRIMLEADVQLKKDTASYTSPQAKEGREYWDKLYKKAEELFGTENITIPTLTRPWIVPDEIILRESPDNSAYIYKATLKVMLEEDYLKTSNQPVLAKRSGPGKPVTSNQVYSFSDPRLKELNQYSTQLIKETIIPKLTQEINSSRRYAPLRQVYYSLILAQHFKRKFAKQPSGQAGENPYVKLIDSCNLTNLTSKEPWDKLTCFQGYQKSFQQGEYNIQEPVYTPTGQAIRSYFSGGQLLTNILRVTTVTPGFGPPSISGSIHLKKIDYSVSPVAKGDVSLLTGLRSSSAIEERNNASLLSMGNSTLKGRPTRIMLSFFSNVRDKSKLDNPLGVAVLGGTLKQQLKDTVHIVMAHHLIDGGVEGIIEKIKIEHPEILGLSLGFGSLQQLITVMQYIRSLPAAERPIVALGNVVATYNTEFFLKQYPEVFICAGQGEMAIVDLVKYRRGEIKKNEIHDVVYMNDGQIIANPRSQSFLVDMGTPMTDFLPDVVKSGGVVYMETSRGCPFNCTICARRPFLGIGWKGRNLDNIIGDMEKAANLGVKFINFVDEDLFAGGMKRVIRFAQMIHEARKAGRIPDDLIFGTSVSVRNIYRINDSLENNLKRKQALELLKEAGLTVLFIGIESGSPKQLERYGKAATIKENEEAIRIIEDCGIWTIPGFIMLDPLVTIEEIRENIDFLRRTGMDARITYPLKTYIPMIGSSYTQKLIEEGLVYSVSYIPDRLAYEYSFREKRVADILKRIKDWEESQAMFFWDLKIIFRSSRFGELSRDKQELVRTLVDKQTKILLDYLDEMVNLSLSEIEQKEVFQRISFKFGVRLINDMLEALQYVENGYLPLGDKEFRSIIQKSIIREILRLYFTQKQFSMEEVRRIISEEFHYKFKEDILKEIFALFIKEERIKQIDDKTFCLHEKFFVYRNIPWPDLPRPAKVIVGIDDLASSPLIPQKVKFPGGIDLRFLPIVTQAISNLSLNASRIPLSKLDSINLNQEWRQIQKMVEAGITPSAERIKEYIQLSYLNKGEPNDMQKVISCIADILRSEEERCVSTEPTLKDILVVLESGRSAQELKAVFTGSQS
ncbi:MAG: radical SAM protein [Candidatus Omnitrophota bacterium]|nr:radical SAM protein [Candidatus Omnitrophota bacterium]